MPPTVLPEETGADTPFKPITSKKWLVQVAFLFGLLVLGRGSRHVSAQHVAASPPAPPQRSVAEQPAVAQVRQHQLLPTNYPLVSSLSFAGPGQ